MRGTMRKALLLALLLGAAMVAQSPGAAAQAAQRGAGTGGATTGAATTGGKLVAGTAAPGATAAAKQAGAGATESAANETATKAAAGTAGTVLDGAAKAAATGAAVAGRAGAGAGTKKAAAAGTATTAAGGKVGAAVDVKDGAAKTQGGKTVAGTAAAAAKGVHGADTAGGGNATAAADAAAVKAGTATATGPTGAKAAAEEEEEGKEGEGEDGDVGAGLSFDGPEIVAHTEEELESAVKAAVEAQQHGKRKKVVNSLIAQAKPAELPGGDDDIPIDGACQSSIRQFCRKARPGEGRLAQCLLRQAHAAAENPIHPELPTACQKELDAYMAAVSSNVNANVPLAKACKRDITQHCGEVSPENQGGVLACLRKKRAVLRGKCEHLVFELEAAASDDFRLDPQLVDACKADIARFCSQQIADPHGGEVQSCLVGHEGSLEWRCTRELFRQEMEESDDIRLSLGLLQACYDSKEQFCEGVAPGDGNVKDCLEAHMWEDGFGDECRATLAVIIGQRSKYFRLDSLIRKHCLDDMSRLCNVNAELVGAVDFLGAPLIIEEDGISNCLQDKREEIRNPACATRVEKVISATLRGMSFNHPLAEACAKDREALCADEPLGSPGVVHCLGRQREKLTNPDCAAKLFDTEVAMAENIEFNWPLKEACTPEIKKHCGGVAHGRGRVIRCLQHAAEKRAQDFSDKCQEAVQSYEARAGSDYRLNFRLASACKDDVRQLCPDACGALARNTGCGGSVLQCLTTWEGHIQADECRTEVQYFQLMRVRHFRNDVSLAESCREDVERFCLEVGEGRILACLHEHRPELSAGCRAEEMRLDILQSQSIDLRPAVAAACAEERKAHCHEVRADKGAVLNCLLFSASSDLGFSGGCVAALDALQQRRLLDWRTDYQLREACTADVGRHCGEANKTSDPVFSATAGLDGGVFSCLADRHVVLEAGCGAEVSRASLTALEFYQPGLPAANACDDDVAMLCAHAVDAERPALGAIRECLSEQLESERAAEAGASSGSTPGFAGTATAAEEAGSAAEGERRRRRLGQLSSARGVGSGVGSGHVSSSTEANWRRRQQEQAEGEVAADAGAATEGDGSAWEMGSGGEAGGHPGVQLSPSCRAFLDVALAPDAYINFQDSMTATGVLTQLASIEKELGLPHGSLHNPTATAGPEVLTLTGWVALVGIFALATVVLALGVFVTRRYMGLGAPGVPPSRSGYTMVVKHETEMMSTSSSDSSAARGASPARGLPRRYG